MQVAAITVAVTGDPTKSGPNSRFFQATTKADDAEARVKDLEREVEDLEGKTALLST